MRTTFALFTKYSDAKQAVDELLDKNFKKETINVIAQKSAVESNWDVNERTINVDVTNKIGEKKVGGLEEMLGHRQPIQTNTEGELYAAGEIAKVLAGTLSAPGTVEGGMQGALVDFGVSEDPASELAEGIRGGGLLVFVRTEDERASQATDVLNEQKARHVATVRG